jgi:hypothetical protein
VDYWAYVGFWEGSWITAVAKAEPYTNPLYWLETFNISDNVVQVKLPLSYIGNPSSFHWYASTFDNSGEHTLTDDAPDVGHIKWRR